MTTKSEVSRLLARKASITKESAESLVDDVLFVMRTILIERGRLNLTGFGTFTAKLKAERPGRNPRTGEPVTVPARKRVSFKASDLFVDELNEEDLPPSGGLTQAEVFAKEDER